MEKFKPRQPDPFIKKASDQEIAKFGHLNAIVEFLNNIAPGGVVSITGLNIDNTNPATPIINISVDGVTITGSGTPGDPLVAGGLNSDDIINVSTITGANVSEALENLLTGLLPPDAVIIDVDAATTAALAANTYANGAAGVGATITINANGAFPTIDLQVAVLNKVYLIKNETGANRLKNGIYQLTTLGTVGTQAVLTRVTGADTSSELTNVVAFCAYNTGTNRNRYFIQATDSPTVGTSPIVWGTPAAGSSQNLSQVLTIGNDAGANQILASIGTELLPGYSFFGDPNTGLWSSAGGVIKVSIDGFETLEIDAQGLKIPAGIKLFTDSIETESGAGVIIEGGAGGIDIQGVTFINLTCLDVFIGDTTLSGNDTLITVDDTAQTIELAANTSIDFPDWNFTTGTGLVPIVDVAMNIGDATHGINNIVAKSISGHSASQLTIQTVNDQNLELTIDGAGIITMNTAPTYTGTMAGAAALNVVNGLIIA